MKKSMKRYKTLKKALIAVGYDIEIPKRYKPIEICVIDNRILEVRFATIIARKAKYADNLDDKGISGVYFDSCSSKAIKNEFEVDGVKGIEYWNGSSKSPKCYLAIWNDAENEYSYSIYSSKGIKPKVTSKWYKLFK